MKKRTFKAVTEKKCAVCDLTSELVALVEGLELFIE